MVGVVLVSRSPSVPLCVCCLSSALYTTEYRHHGSMEPYLVAWGRKTVRRRAFWVQTTFDTYYVHVVECMHCVG